ncbi:MAG: putative phosphoribosyl transferase [Solirubrobacterales bacterium]|jgi:predicted phosphoribosyltransferase|nr:putative phosphoribosyl transferase [Solirubrobacterales bacterium]
MSAREAKPRTTRFADRRDAGRQLAAQLLPLAKESPIVVGLPRGGIPVAEEIAIALHARLEPLAVRKLGAPHNPEYGIGAIAEDGTRVFDEEALAVLGINGAVLEEIVARETAELRRRVEAYRGERPFPPLQDRTVIVVDDGVATGVTDTAALRAIRRLRPRRLILAVPVCAPDSAARLRREADEVICLVEPQLLHGVGQWYADFTQVSDADVVTALKRFRAGRGKAADGWRLLPDGVERRST